MASQAAMAISTVSSVLLWLGYDKCHDPRIEENHMQKVATLHVPDFIQSLGPSQSHAAEYLEPLILPMTQDKSCRAYAIGSV